MRELQIIDTTKLVTHEDLFQLKKYFEFIINSRKFLLGPQDNDFIEIKPLEQSSIIKINLVKIIEKKDKYYASFFNNFMVAEKDDHNNIVIEVPIQEYNFFDLYIKIIYSLIKNKIFLIVDSKQKLSEELQDNFENLFKVMNYSAFNLNYQANLGYLKKCSFPIFSFFMIYNHNLLLKNLDLINDSTINVFFKKINCSFIPLNNVFTFQEVLITALNYNHYGIYSNLVQLKYSDTTDNYPYATFNRARNSYLVFMKKFFEIYDNYINKIIKNHSITTKYDELSIFYYLIIDDSFFNGYINENFVNIFEKIKQKIFIEDISSYYNEISYKNNNLIISGNSGTGKTQMFLNLSSEYYTKIDLSHLDEDIFFIKILDDIFEYIETRFINDNTDCFFINKPIKYLVLVDEFNRNQAYDVISKYLTLFDYENDYSKNSYNIKFNKKIFLEFFGEKINKINDNFFPKKENPENPCFSKIFKLIKHEKLFNLLKKFLFFVKNSSDESLHKQSDNFHIPVFLTSMTDWWFIINPVDINTKEFNLMYSRRFTIQHQPITKPKNLDFQYVIDNELEEHTTWDDIRTFINNRFKSLGIPSDKYIGYFFWNEHDKTESRDCINSDGKKMRNISIKFNTFKNKVAHYIYYVVLNNGTNYNFQFNKIDEFTTKIFNYSDYNDILNSTTFNDFIKDYHTPGFLHIKKILTPLIENYEKDHLSFDKDEE